MARSSYTTGRQIQELLRQEIEELKIANAQLRMQLAAQNLMLVQLGPLIDEMRRELRRQPAIIAGAVLAGTSTACQFRLVETTSHEDKAA